MNLLQNQFRGKIFFSVLLLLSFFSVFAQGTKPKEVFEVKIDSLYREDQFYFGFNYNTLQQMPEDASQQKFSIGISGGFLRDMPINKTRTKAFATGLGVSYNNYNQNIGISGTAQDAIYTVLGSQSNFDKNKFTQLLVDVPLEFRWRTSTYESYKFWRIYGGMKFSYLVYSKSVLQDDQGKIVITNNADFNKFLYGLYLSAGYNTLNVYAYYGLNPLFKSAEIDGKKINMKAVSVGLIFYIL
ncbi:porin family protein [Flavobacterium undicola]|uniref:porin family protein n=1 Tax=Flavobacterium undicola TaxID=1932779 RepID=UPI00137684B6|nr:porin family protein [Flavobacterium undicola]MBA0882746.1 PorT family protein [Flavobacterium undicola]